MHRSAAWTARAISDETKNGVGTIHAVLSRPVAVFVKYLSILDTNLRSFKFLGLIHDQYTVILLRLEEIEQPLKHEYDVLPQVVVEPIIRWFDDASWDGGSDQDRAMLSKKGHCFPSHAQARLTIGGELRPDRAGVQLPFRKEGAAKPLPIVIWK